MKRIFFATLLGLFVTAVYADYLVVPTAYESTTGNLGYNSVIRDESRTIQFVYAAGDLASLATGTEITGISFRIYTGYATWPATAVNWNNYDITLSTCATAPGSLVGTFASNIGPDATLVRSGPLAVPAGVFPGGPGVNPWGMEFAFTTPYVYQEGNSLLFTISHDGNGSSAQYVDFITTGYGNSMVYNTGYNSSSGGIYPGTYICRLTYNIGIVPLSGWSIVIGLVLITSVIIYQRFRNI